jgi:hypothetical protein
VPARGPIVALVKLAAAAIVLLPLAVVALVSRRETARRRAAGLRPRLLWGPEPLVNISYWSGAMRDLGYESTTVVHDPYAINAREDFDRLIGDFGHPSLLGGPFRHHLAFAWALRHGDVFCSFLSGGFLSATPLRDLEARLLRLAGKRLIVSPYGSDIAVAGHLGPLEEAMAVDYPELVASADAVRARVDWFCANADVVVRTLQPGYLPRSDVLWPSQLAIDTGRFAPGGERGAHDGRDGEVVVVHAFNHRTLKSTDDVIAAVDALGAEGLDVRLQLLERRPNDEVREALRTADVLVEQLLCGFGMLAVEGMASGIPVVTGLRWMDPEVRGHPSIADSPMVDAGVEDLVDRLRELVTDPARRAELGRAGREHALRWNSYDAIGRTWAAIVEAAWTGGTPPPDAEPLPAASRPSVAASGVGRA